MHSIQKKLNYEVIVNECNNRLEACIEQISEFSEKIKIDEKINVVQKEKNRILEFFNKLIHIFAFFSQKLHKSIVLYKNNRILY